MDDDDDDDSHRGGGRPCRCPPLPPRLTCLPKRSSLSPSWRCRWHSAYPSLPPRDRILQQQQMHRPPPIVPPAVVAFDIIAATERTTTMLTLASTVARWEDMGWINIATVLGKMMRRRHRCRRQQRRCIAIRGSPPLRERKARARRPTQVIHAVRVGQRLEDERV